jgi:two-component system, OmpR family, sensor histidine kinase BaeS
MRSIAVKLTLAFLLIGITGAVLVAVITQLRTRSAFNVFVLDREQQALADNLVQYYLIRGSWNGVADNFQALTNPPMHPLDRRFGSIRNFPAFTLVDADHSVVLSSASDQIGRKMSAHELDTAVPLALNDTTIGWLLLPSTTHQVIPLSPESNFLTSVNRASLLSGGVAAGLALILGGLLAFTMTRSLRELTEASNEIARGNFGLQVRVRSHDEVGRLADAFNKMSRDLDRTTQARRKMTADIAHELRTPLSVILGYAEGLSDNKLPGTPEIYEILFQETKHMNHLVEDLRTLSLADAGELQLNLLPYSPNILLERVAARHNLAAQQKGISLQVSTLPDIPPAVVDPERMVQVFDNLIGNALRYTPRGGQITLHADAGDGTIQFQVSDNGSGIGPADLPYVFDRFYRADKSRQQNGESGLGLAIARSIVEAHGGTISIESQPGQGTAFMIIVPAAKPS